MWSQSHGPYPHSSRDYPPWPRLEAKSIQQQPWSLHYLLTVRAGTWCHFSLFLGFSKDLQKDHMKSLHEVIDHFATVLCQWQQFLLCHKSMDKVILKSLYKTNYYIHPPGRFYNNTKWQADLVTLTYQSQIVTGICHCSNCVSKSSSSENCLVKQNHPLW